MYYHNALFAKKTASTAMIKRYLQINLGKEV